MQTLTLADFSEYYEANGQYLDLEARHTAGKWILTGHNLNRNYNAALACAEGPNPREFDTLDELALLVKIHWPASELSLQLWDDTENA